MNNYVTKIRATVKHRREGFPFPVKPEAEQIEGNRYSFTFGWDIDDDDRRYPGEQAWVPTRAGWPDGAPAWIALGDLIDIEPA